MPSRFLDLAVWRSSPIVGAAGDSRVSQRQSRLVGVFGIGIGVDEGFKGKVGGGEMLPFGDVHGSLKKHFIWMPVSNRANR